MLSYFPGFDVSDNRFPMRSVASWLRFIPLFSFFISTTLASSPGQLRQLPEPEHIILGDVVQEDAGTHTRSPSQVRKMSDNAGEKFWPNYWDLGDLTKTERDNPLDDSSLEPNYNHSVKRDMKRESLDELWAENGLAVLQPAYPLHARDIPFSFSSLGRSVLNLRSPFSLVGKRDFECPAGTSACTSINRPSSCCGPDSTCQIVDDTGLGDVGCCAKEDDCSGRLVSCAEGYSSCPDNPGGGCCIPGYSCVDDGCLFISTTTVIVTMSRSSTSETIHTTSAPPTEPGSVDPPFRPTSNPTSATTFTVTPSNTVTSTTREIPDDCPVGFYACQAVYSGGCCRTGRDCNPTSCPAVPSTTITSNGVTIVVPVEITSGPGLEPPSHTAVCAEGWTSCAKNAGGGCCPDGFQCGETSCSASATGIGTGVVGKIPPENSGSRFAPVTEFGKLATHILVVWSLVNAII